MDVILIDGAVADASVLEKDRLAERDAFPDQTEIPVGERPPPVADAWSGRAAGLCGHLCAHGNTVVV